MTSVDMPMTSLSDVSYHGRSGDGQSDPTKSKYAKQDKSPVHSKKVMYPPRLLVDFNSLHIEALNKYVAFYQIPVREECTKDELAALVARHFDGSLEVEEDESILSFVTRVRNGEKTARGRTPAPKPAASIKKPPRASDDTKASSVASTAVTSSSTNKRSRDDDHEKDNEGDAPEGAAPVAPPPAKKHVKGKTKEKSSSDSKGKKNDDNELYCVCNLPGYGAMIACDGEQCPNPSQWYHLECVGFSDGQHPDTWFCPECDPKAFAAVQKKKKKSGRGSGDDKSSKSSSGSSGSSLRR